MREAQYSAQLSAADLENERLTEQAAWRNISSKFAGQDGCRKLYNETVEADQKELDLTRALYETGMTDQISVVEAETTLQSAEAGAPTWPSHAHSTSMRSRC